MGKGLNARQRAFVAAYVVSRNATQSAITAGYSVKTAEQQGPRLLGNAEIALAIREGEQMLQVRTHFTQDQVLNELALLAFSNVDHYEVDDDGNVQVKADAPKGAIRAVSSIKRRVTTDPKGNVTREVELRLWDKPGPLKTAGRHVGLFSDKSHEEIEREVDKRIGQLVEQAREARAAGAITVAATPTTPPGSAGSAGFDRGVDQASTAERRAGTGDPTK
jgi:phage terminase small subunit